MARTQTVADFLKGITTDDGRGNKAARVVVSAENRPPSNILLSSEDVEDGSQVGDRVAVITVVDPNDGEQHLITIVSDPDDMFAIENPQTAVGTNTYLTLKKAVDYDTSTTHEVILKATDPTDLSIEVQFTINVLEAFFDRTSLVLDGVDEYVQAANPSNFHFNDGADDIPFTFAKWIKLEDATNFRIFSKGSTTNRELLFATLSGDQLTMIVWGEATGAIGIRQDSTTPLTSVEGTWIHVGATYDGSNLSSGIKLYLNGALLSSTATTTGTYVGVRDSGDPLIIGAWAGSGFADGYLDQGVVVSGRALTSVEMAELYNAGVPYDLEQHSRYDDFLSWWRYELDKGDDSTSITGVIQDFKGSNDLTPFNTEAGDLVEDTP